MTSRAAFMLRVREALGRRADAAPPPPPPALDEGLVRLAGPGAGLVDLFAQRAADVGMAVYRTRAPQLAAALEVLLVERSVARVAISMSAGPLATAARSAAQRARASVVDWRATPGLEAHFDADAGITDVQAAVAESGTLVVGSSADHSRGTYLLPPLHIAIVERERIVPDLLDLWPRAAAAAPAALPAATVLITGPSKTADIEGILVTGVHGPREVHVVIVEPGR